MSLNQAQRNAVTTTLVQLDQALDEIERLLDGPTSGITYATDWAPPATLTYSRVR